jgi:hypothetical protein
MSVKVAVIVTMAISVLSACTIPKDTYKPYWEIFTINEEHNGLTLRQKLDRLSEVNPISGMPTFGTTMCTAAVERFRPDGNNLEDYKKAEQEIVQIFEEFLDVALINGKVLSAGAQKRRFGVSCNVGVAAQSRNYHQLALSFCRDAGGRNCIIVMSTKQTYYDSKLAAVRASITFAEQKIISERKEAEQKIISERKEKENFLASLSSQCEVFGYTKGTEKFADCMKDLYLKETNSEQQSVQNNSGTDAQLQVLRQQLELQRQQAAAAAEAEKRRQGFELMNQGLNTLNPSPPPSNRPLTCRTMSNGITTCQ